METRIPLEIMPDSDAAGSYGPSEDSTPSYGSSFEVPYLVVDGKGRISTADTKIITLPPASSATSVNWSNVIDKPNSFIPSEHSSATAEYGISSSTVYGHAKASSTIPLAAGSASVGSETAEFARGDHVHPQQVNVSGNAGTATRLETPRNIVLTGDASGSASFDGSDNASITVSTVKEAAYMSSAPTSANTGELDNESIIFYAEEQASGGSSFYQPVYTSGNQTIDGVKTFASGVFKNSLILSSGTSSIDVSSAACFTKTVTSATTFSFTNIPSGVFCSIVVILNNGGNYVVTWPSNIKWAGNEAPDLTENGTDVLTFLTGDGGGTWFGKLYCSYSNT